MERSHFHTVMSVPPTLRHLPCKSSPLSFAKISIASACRRSIKAKDIVPAVGEFFAVAGIAARAALNVFREHVTLGDGIVPQQIAQREFARSIAPIHL